MSEELLSFEDGGDTSFDFTLDDVPVDPFTGYKGQMIVEEVKSYPPNEKGFARAEITVSYPADDINQKSFTGSLFVNTKLSKLSTEERNRLVQEGVITQGNLTNFNKNNANLKVLIEVGGGTLSGVKKQRVYGEIGPHWQDLTRGEYKKFGVAR